MATFGIELAGTDIGASLVSKEYLLDKYPDIADKYKTAGLWLWGSNGYNALGGGSVAAKVSSPVQTATGGINWKTVSVGAAHVGGVKTDGTLWMWGKNDAPFYSLGVAGATGTSPTQVAGTTWVDVSCHAYATIGLKSDGTIWTWGYNGQGQLGDGTTVTKSTPVQIGAASSWKSLTRSTNGFNMGAFKTDGTLWVWGDSGYGGLGIGSQSQFSTPQQLVGSWKQVFMAVNSGVGIRTDGTLWTWGRNHKGQLGNNSTTGTSSPVQTSAAGTNWKQASGGYFHIAAVKTDGTLWAWGNNYGGQLGNNSTANVSTPVQVIGGGTTWSRVSTLYTGTAAIKTDGTMWVWGKGANGQLATNNQNMYSSPVQTIAGGNNWKSIYGSGTVAAIRDDTADFGIGTL